MVMFIFRSLVLLQVSLLAYSASATETSSNVVLIMVDDMGYNELGITGQLQRAADGLNHIQTPNIDSLATGGLLLTNFYASPICASSRSALMTGFHNGHSSVDRNGGNNGGNAIRAEDFTIGELFQQAGYRTGQYGKWGLGGFDHNVAGVSFNNPTTAVINFPEAIPTQQGFNEYYGYLHQVRAHSYYQQYQWEHDDIGGVQVHLTSSADYSHDLISERALQFITNNHASPFFLYLPFTIPHSDFDPPIDEIYNVFINDGYSVSQARYAAMMKRLDNTIGDVVSRLTDPNMDGSFEDSVLTNTVIMFCSDNGGTGENSLFNGGGNLRGQKGSVHEGGIATPFIVFWDGTIAPGQVNTNRIGSIDDLMVTCANLIGVEPPFGSDGGSLADLITGQQVLNVRPYHVFEARNNNDWAIRMGEWKLSRSGNNNTGLFNLVDDPDESNNISNANPEISSLLQQIVLEEGVQSDAGSSPTQTTNIVQYKEWSASNGSIDFNDADNWIGGSQFNTRGTPANNFASPPASNWIATIKNNSIEIIEVLAEGNATVLGLDLQTGNSSTNFTNAGTITASNGVKIGSNCNLNLDGGTIQTCRKIQVGFGGLFTGSGDVQPQYDTTGTPFQLKSIFINSGVVEITPAETGELETVVDGGFEVGVGFDFNEIENWENYSGDQTLNGRNASNPFNGTHRGIIGKSSNGSGVSPAQMSGGLADASELQFSLRYAAASGWDIGIDEFTATIFYLDDDSNNVDLYSTNLTPTIHFSNGYSLFSETLPPFDVAAHGRPLWVRFESLAANSEFASIDAISLTKTNQAVRRNLCVKGTYQQTETGSLSISVSNPSGVPGMDYDQLSVEGNILLDGCLSIELDENYTPAIGDVFEIISAHLITGVFDEINFPQVAGVEWQLLYTNTSVVLIAEQGILLGDVNLDGAINLLDISPFVSLITDGEFQLEADINRDGEVNLLDVAPFVALLQN